MGDDLKWKDTVPAEVDKYGSGLLLGKKKGVRGWKAEQCIVRHLGECQ